MDVGARLNQRLDVSYTALVAGDLERCEAPVTTRYAPPLEERFQMKAFYKQLWQTLRQSSLYQMLPHFGEQAFSFGFDLK